MSSIKWLKVMILAASLVFVAVKAQASAPSLVEKVKSHREGDVFTAELEMKGEWKGQDAKVQFSGEDFHIDFAKAALAKEKHTLNIDDRLIKSILVSQPDSTTLRAKVVLKEGFLAKSLENSVRIRRQASSIVIEVLGDARTGQVAKKEKDLVRTFSVTEDNMRFDESSELATKLVANTNVNAKSMADDHSEGIEKIPETTTSDVTDEQASAEAKLSSEEINKLPESEIPVLANVKAEKKEAGGNFHRILMTLGVLVITLGAVSFGLKRWASKSKSQTQTTKIKVLTQHHLGPKKSLAIIQVAGESLLIGVTDHNISMLKTLALLDEEIPEDVPNRFDRTLDGFDDEEPMQETRGRSRRGENDDIMTDSDEDFTMRGLSEIRDVVSKRLKNMRNL